MTSIGRDQRVSPQRHGLVSVALIIGLIILGLVAAGMLKVAIARRSAAQSEENRRQAELLLDSALDRALTRLDSNPQYDGEIWEISAPELGGRSPARVTINLQSNEPLSRRLVVVAEYQTSTPQAVRLSRTTPLPLPPVTR